MNAHLKPRKTHKAPILKTRVYGEAICIRRRNDGVFHVWTGVSAIYDLSFIGASIGDALTLMANALEQEAIEFVAFQDGREVK